MSVAKNYNILKIVARDASDANKARILNLAELYQSRKIKNFTTALNIALMLKVKHKLLVNTAKPIQTYEKVVAKANNKKPKVIPKKGPNITLPPTIKNIFEVELILYQSVNNTKNKKARKRNRSFKGLQQVYQGKLNLDVQGIDPDDFFGRWKDLLMTIDLNALKQLIGNDLPEDLHQEHSESFSIMMKLLKTNPEIKDFLSSHGDTYITRVLTQSYNPEDASQIVPADPRNAISTSEYKASSYFAYRSTQLDLSKRCLKEAMENQKYIRYECWLNAIVDFYGDTLLSPGKKRNVITRQKILQIIRRTEDNIKNGLAIADVLPFLRSLIYL